MPENTIPAFLKALDLGATTLELDVVISKDQQVVVSHDPYINAAFSRTPAGKAISRKEQKNLLLYKMDYATIRQYDVGAVGNPDYPEQQKISTYKPLLSEVIDQAEAYRKARNLPAFSYNIEIKSTPSAYNRSQPEPAEFCDLVQSVIDRYLKTNQQGSALLTPDRIIIQSFDFNVLTYWHQQMQSGNYPAVRLSVLIENLRSSARNIRKLGFKPAIYSSNYRLLNRKRINRLHEQAIDVIPWTVNQRSVMERLKQWGVDGLITDYPDRARGL